jgi:hypothetical protein
MNFKAAIHLHPLQNHTLDAGEWDSFVRKSDNGTLFHERNFLGYHPEGRFTDDSLYFTRNGKLFAVFPAADIHRNGKRILSSHGGASYGGFVHHPDLNLQDAFTLVEQMKDYAVQKGYDAIQLTLPPVIYSGHISNYLDFALIKNGFGYLKREISSVVDLSFQGEEQLLSGFRPEARTALKKARRMGVTIRECHNYQEYYEILKKNLRMRHGVSPTHSLDELLLLQQKYPRDIRLWGAFAGDKLIAGVCNFSANQRVVLAFYISHDEEFQEYRAVNLLFTEIMKQYSKEGFAFLDFGIFTVNMEPNWGLGRFKENFGSRGIFRDTFLLNLNG